MKIEELYKMLMADQIKDLVVKNEDGVAFITYAIKMDALKHFHIVINGKPGHTRINTIAETPF